MTNITLIIFFISILVSLIYLCMKFCKRKEDMTKQKILVSFTTIPKRINKNLVDTLKSMINQQTQPDYIIVNIPYEYNNFPNDFVIPDYLNFDHRIIINRCKDYGPATKILGLFENNILSLINDKDIIVIIDDDRNYDPDLISNFIVKFNENTEERVLTNSGQNINGNGERKKPNNKEVYIDTLQGCCAFAFYKKNIPMDNELMNINPDNDCYYADDIWFSGFFDKNNVGIDLINGKDPMRNNNDNINSLYSNEQKPRNNVNANCIKFLQDKYDIWKYDNIDYNHVLR